MNKTVKNLIYNGLYQLLIIALPIITVPYVARVLGARALGENSYITSVGILLGYVIILGMNQLGVREIAKISASKDELTITFSRLWGLQFIVGILVTLSYIGITYRMSNNIYYLANIPYLLGFMLDISWFFVGIGEISRVVTRNTVIKFLSLILIFSCVHSSNDLLLYILINSSALMLSNLVFWMSLRKKIWTTKILKNLFSSKYIKSSLILGLPQIAVQFYTNFDSVIVGYIAGAVQLSYYDQSQKIARMLLALITSTSTVLMPKLVKLMQNDKDNKRSSDLLKKSLDYTLIISLFITFLIMINVNELVPWFFGNKFSPMINNMFWVSLIIIFISFGSVFSNQYALANGLYRIFAIPYFFGAIFSIISNIIFVHLWKADGGTTTIILTELIVCILRVWLVKKNFNFKVLFRQYWKYFLTFCVSLLFCVRIHIVVSSNFVSMILNSFIGTFVFLLLLVIFQPPAVNEALSFIFIKMKHYMTKK